MKLNYQGWLRHFGKTDSVENLVEFLILAGCAPIDVNPLHNYVWYSRFALDYRIEV